MSRTLQFKASPTQRLALKYLQDKVTTEIGFGGAAGGGKSYIIVAFSWMLCQSYPGVRLFWGRKELKRLKQTTLATWYKFLSDYNVPKDQQGNFNSQDSTISFPNGSEILLLDCAYQPSDPLYTRFGGLECTMGFLDESNEIEEQCVAVLSSRIGRCKNEEYNIKQKIFETFNPDKGHVYRRYYKPYKNGTMPEHRTFIVSKIEDNKLVDRGYREQLERLPEVQKQRLLHGNFDYDDTPGRLYEYNSLTDLFTNPKNNGEKYITADIAREGKDSTSIYVWDGWEVIERVKIAKSKLDVVWDKIKALAQQYNIGMSHVVCDEDGVGGGVVDYLKCVGFVNNSSPISYGDAKLNPWLKRNYANLKTQCYFLLQDPIQKRLIKLPDCPDKDKIIEEFDAVVQIDIDKEGPLRIIKKEDIKQKIGRSPDDSDAIMLRMWFELKPNPKTFGEVSPFGDAVDPAAEPIVIYGSIEDYFNKTDKSEVPADDWI